MGLSRSFEISASGMDVERQRLEVAAMNLANARTTRTAEGSAFHRKVLLARAAEADVQTVSTGIVSGSAVEVQGIVDDVSPPRREFDPGHPDAGADGWVVLPNVDPVTEMVDVMMATRGYEANVAVFQAAREMAQRALEMGRS